MQVLIILRGLPGSGKSSLANVLSEKNRWPVFSIDDFFTDPVTGHYSFRFADNHLAYKHCQDRVEQAMQTHVEKIILDNTFTLSWEIEPYFNLASRHHYRVHVVTVENYHGGKNQHGISEEQVQKMAEKYRVKLL